MSSSSRTPRQRPDGAASAVCPFCQKKIRVTVAGRFALHPATDRWKRKMCRGSGEPVFSQPR